MSNPKELLRNELPGFVAEFDRALLSESYLEQRVEELEGELESYQRRVADLEAQNRALKGQLAALVVDKEIGEVLPS